jgi:hypothetical protein
LAAGQATVLVFGETCDGEPVKNIDFYSATRITDNFYVTPGEGQAPAKWPSGLQPCSPPACVPPPFRP